VGTIVNLTKYTATHAVDVGIDGRWHVTVTVEGGLFVDKDGHAIPAETPPFAEVDEFAGEPATSGLLRASEVGPPKTKVDVLLAGAIVFPKPVTEVDVELAVGTRLRKRARVFGIACGFRECLDFRSCVRRPSVEKRTQQRQR